MVKMKECGIVMFILDFAGVMRGFSQRVENDIMTPVLFRAMWSRISIRTQIITCILSASLIDCDGLF
jgi:hypothetical protein